MADPLSIVGLMSTIGQVTTQLCSYGAAVNGSKAEMKNLVVEVFALKGVLEAITAKQDDIVSEAHHTVDDKIWGAMAEMTRETLLAVQRHLKEPRGKVDAAKKALSWPFTKLETDKYVATLERAKSWFLMVIMKETSDVTNKLYSEMLDLSNRIHDDLGERKAERQLKEDSELLRWLAPARSEEDHFKFNKLRAPGSGEWFFDETFNAWIDPGVKTKRMLWVTGKCKMSLQRNGVLCLRVPTAGAGKTILV